MSSIGDIFVRPFIGQQLDVAIADAMAFVDTNTISANVAILFNERAIYVKCIHGKPLTKAQIVATIPPNLDRVQSIAKDLR